VTSFPPGFDLDSKSLAMLAIPNLVSRALSAAPSSSCERFLAPAPGS
jgi:hypothetical protein